MTDPTHQRDLPGWSAVSTLTGLPAKDAIGAGRSVATESRLASA